MLSNGIYGKLPAHGDFVQRNLPGGFITPWDDWLQRAVHGAREVVGEPWLDYYLTSPIWRFAFSAGVVDAHIWAGILVPSVDSVGRYFPMTLADSRPNGENPFSIMYENEAWYQSLSDLAIETLQNNLQVDEVLERFPLYTDSASAVTCDAGVGGMTVLKGGGVPADSYAQLLNKLTKNNVSSFSLWWCGGSQHLAPTTMLCPGLPDPSNYISMLGAAENYG